MLFITIGLIFLYLKSHLVKVIVHRQFCIFLSHFKFPFCCFKAVCLTQQLKCQLIAGIIRRCNQFHLICCKKSVTDIILHAVNNYLTFHDIHIHTDYLLRFFKIYKCVLISSYIETDYSEQVIQLNRVLRRTTKLISFCEIFYSVCRFFVGSKGIPQVKIPVAVILIKLDRFFIALDRLFILSQRHIRISCTLISVRIFPSKPDCLVRQMQSFDVLAVYECKVRIC